MTQMTMDEVVALCPEFNPQAVDGKVQCGFKVGENGCSLAKRTACIVKLKAQAREDAAYRESREDDRAAQDSVLNQSWSHSRITTFQRCPYKFKLKYVDKLEPEMTPLALNVGKAYHAALESVYDSKGRDLVIHGTGIEVEDIKIRAVLEGLADAGLLYRPGEYEIERRLNFEVNGIPFAGFMDLYAIATKAIEDWKTTPNPAAVKLRSNLYQLAVYKTGAEACGYEVAELWINAIRKPALRIKKNEELLAFGARVRKDVAAHPNNYLVRHRYLASECNWELYMNEMVDQVGLIKECVRRNHFPRFPHACAIMTCDYDGVCKSRIV